MREVARLSDRRGPRPGQCRSGARVDRQPGALGHRLVDGGAHHRVPEAVLAGGAGGHDQPATDQLVEGSRPGRGGEVGGVRGDVDDERVAQDGSGLDEPVRLGAETSDLGAHGSGDAPRERGPWAGAVELGEQQRVTAGGREQLGALGLGASVEQLDGVLPAQRRELEEVEGPGSRPGRRDQPLGDRPRAQREQQQVRPGGWVAHEGVDQLERGGVGPVHVVEGDQRGRVDRPVREAGRQVAEELPPFLRLLRWRFTGEPAEQGEGHVGLVLGGPAGAQPESPPCGVIRGELEQAGLADPGLAEQDQHPRPVRSSCVERGVQDRQLGVPAHQVHQRSMATPLPVWVGKPPMLYDGESATLVERQATTQEGAPT